MRKKRRLSTKLFIARVDKYNDNTLFITTISLYNSTSDNSSFCNILKIVLKILTKTKIVIIVIIHLFMNIMPNNNVVCFNNCYRAL